MEITAVGRSPYFGGLRAALARAMRSLGHFVLERDGMPPVMEGDLLLVIGPQDHGPPPGGGKGKRACLMTEQPSPFYPLNAQTLLVAPFYDVHLDILRGRPDFPGKRTWIPAWTEWEAFDPEWEEGRQVDVLFYGAPTPRRQEIVRAIDGAVPVLQPAEFISGETKRIALGSTKVALLVHAFDFAAFEPLRVVEAASCGALIVSEPSIETDGFWREGEDYVAADSASLASAVSRAVNEWDASLSVRKRAWEKARDYTAVRAAKEILAACLA